MTFAQIFTVKNICPREEKNVLPVERPESNNTDQFKTAEILYE